MDWRYWDSGTGEVSEFARSLHFSEDALSVDDFLQEYSKNLPQLARVSEGFYNVGVQAQVDVGELLLILDVTSQTRLIAEDSKSQLKVTLSATDDVVLKQVDGELTLTLKDLSMFEQLPFEGVVQASDAHSQDGRSASGAECSPSTHTARDAHAQKVARPGDVLTVLQSFPERVLVARSVSLEWPMISKGVVYMSEGTPLALHVCTEIKPTESLVFGLPDFLLKAVQLHAELHQEPSKIPQEIAFHLIKEHGLKKNSEGVMVSDIYKMLQFVPMCTAPQQTTEWIELVPRVYAEDKDLSTHKKLQAPPVPPRSDKKVRFGSNALGRAGSLPAPVVLPPPPPSAPSRSLSVDKSHKWKPKIVFNKIAKKSDKSESSHKKHTVGQAKVKAFAVVRPRSNSPEDDYDYPDVSSIASIRKASGQSSKENVEVVGGHPQLKPEGCQNSTLASTMSSFEKENLFNFTAEHKPISPAVSAELAAEVSCSKSNNSSGKSLVSDLYQFKSIQEVPTNIDQFSLLSIADIGNCLKLFNLDQYVQQFKNDLVDGYALSAYDREMLAEQYGMNRFTAMQLYMFANGYRPLIFKEKTQSFSSIQEVPKNTELFKNLSVSEVGECLKLYNLRKYVEPFQNSFVDGMILSSIDEDMLITHLGMDRSAARRIYLFANGHRPS